MRTALACILVLGLAPWAHGGGMKPAVKTGAKANLKGNPNFHGSEKTLAILEAAAKDPPEKYPEFLRPGDKLQMGELMQYHHDQWMVWWGVLTDEGVFEIYCQSREKGKGFSGPVFLAMDPKQLAEPDRPEEYCNPISTPVLNAAYELDECYLTLADDGKLHLKYKFSVGPHQQVRDVVLLLYKHDGTKRSPQPAAKPGSWLWFSGGNPPRLTMVDPNSPGLQDYFKRHPESKPKDALAAGKPRK